MIRINLLPVKRARKAEQLRQHLVVTAAALALTLLICAAVQWQLTRMVDEVTAEVTAKRAEIAALTRQIAEVNDYRKRHEELRAKLEILQKLESSRRGPVLVLDELYRSLPDKLWLESFKEGEGKFAIAGIATDEETVGLFMRNLEVSAQFDKVALGSVQQVLQDGVRLHRFDLTCTPEGIQASEADGPAAVKQKGKSTPAARAKAEGKL